VPLSDSLGCCHDRLRRALRVGLEEGALWLPESDPHDLAAQRTKRPKRRITIILATLMPSAGCVGLGCRVLAESRQSCPRRTTFLRFAGMGVGARCRCPGSAGLRFYVSRAIAFATQGSHPGAPLVRLLGLLRFRPRRRRPQGRVSLFGSRQPSLLCCLLGQQLEGLTDVVPGRRSY